MKEDKGSLCVPDNSRATPWPVLDTAVARCIDAMVNKCLGAPHTPSLPEKMTSEYTQGCTLLIRARGASREASWRRRGTISVSGGHMVGDVGSGLGNR
eukprot:CAMPEP_0201961086 /NCGR_PEP_ID=MMETSP0904-20121228/7649_1 /ASSEMBLY_ACC=CAM_ASM_000553 /TAXON_ID=420261 /ORGANISM="Thalassiosira antarctica, Strain CCMP982" /LENGTH=97 /DNA_ID=CAMNT_0048507189 /DNA_START=275 /DNA_END=565 /DNA_ORIENTATION=-